MTVHDHITRPAGAGWLALIGGGEFSFGETAAADEAWVDRTAAGPVAFLPTASGSPDYGENFAAYMAEVFSREVITVPVYRPRDARRMKNCERLDGVAAVYLGGGVVDHLVEAVADSPFADAVLAQLRGGSTVVAIAAAAQAMGIMARSLLGREPVPGLQWLAGGVVEANFDPGHDRRLRQMMQQAGVSWGLGIPAGAALLLGPAGEVETVGPVFLLEDWDGDYRVLEETDDERGPEG